MDNIKNFLQDSCTGKMLYPRAATVSVSKMDREKGTPLHKTSEQTTKQHAAKDRAESMLEGQKEGLLETGAESEACGGKLRARAEADSGRHASLSSPNLLQLPASPTSHHSCHQQVKTPLFSACQSLP